MEETGSRRGSRHRGQELAQKWTVKGWLTQATERILRNEVAKVSRNKTMEDFI